MFTGLTETKGRVQSIIRSSEKYDIWIDSKFLSPVLKTGDSVAVDGVCQTVVKTTGRSFLVQAVEETLKKTTFKTFHTNKEVNLEKSLTLSSPLGGHIVQGHITGKGIIEEIKGNEKSRYLKISAPENILKYCVNEGSVCIDGISLTVADTDETSFLLNIIPETWERTTLKNKKTQEEVNIEIDIIGRYVVSFLEKNTGDKSGKNKNIKITDMENWGY